MKSLLLGLAAVLLMAQSAFAAGIVAMPPVRTQIYREAKQVGATAGLKRPSLRVRPQSGDRVRATLWSLKRTMPGTPEQRLPRKAATFQIVHTSEGELATPVEVNGKVWRVIQLRGRSRQ